MTTASLIITAYKDLVRYLSYPRTKSGSVYFRVIIIVFYYILRHFYLIYVYIAIFHRPGKWQEAIELILKPRPENDRELAEARQIYAETKNARAAYAKLKRIDTIEARLLKGLQISGDKNPLGVLDSIPRNIRLIYIHAYQSFIWNHVVSRRMKQFGTNVVVGDLVYDKQNCKDITRDETTNYPLNDSDDVRGEIISVEEKDSDPTSNEASKENSEQDFPTVKILMEEDLSNYTLADVVMPQPGWKVTYPPYAKVWFDEFLAKDGLTTDLRQKNK